MKFPGILLLLSLAASAVHADPQLTSWFTSGSGKYARIYTSDADKLAGRGVTTWSNGRQSQDQPAYAGVQAISYSDQWIYLSTTDLPPYTIGPWYDDPGRSRPFVNMPANQGVHYRIPRTATLPPPPKIKTQTSSREDAVGYLVDGVALFDPTDGFTYSNGTERNPGPGQWHRDAYFNERVTFDPGNSHQQNMGKYHNHADPLALRYLMDDHIDFNPAAGTYSESRAKPTKHSPILGWVRDGYPIYGPYGFANPMDPASGIRRMVSGFVKRDGAMPGVDDLSRGARTLPVWALRNSSRPPEDGPTVSSRAPIGRYLEDWAYLGDLTNPATGRSYQLGTDFDLNEYNVRYCVTPEFPQGTYAYFMCITADGAPTMPYNLNRYFFGTPTGGTSSEPENATPYFKGGPDSSNDGHITNMEQAHGDITLTWQSVEGGTYKVESSTDDHHWNTVVATKSAAQKMVSTSIRIPAMPGQDLAFRVTRTSLADYDRTSILPEVSSPGIRGITPAAGVRGNTFVVTLQLNPRSHPMLPPPHAPILRVAIGGVECQDCVRVDYQTVRATVTLPQSIRPGSEDVTLVFPGPPDTPQDIVSYTLAKGFEVREGAN